MRYNVSLPWWAYAVMGLGLAVFIGLVGLSIRRNHGIKRSLFSAPYTMWMILFTILPCILIAYYAFTDTAGNFTLDNFRTRFYRNEIICLPNRVTVQLVLTDEEAADIPDV